MITYDRLARRLDSRLNERELLRLDEMKITDCCSHMAVERRSGGAASECAMCELLSIARAY